MARIRSFRIIVMVALCSVFVPAGAFAQETQPGAACTPGEEDRVRQVGGPENSGVGYVLVCDGANWKLVKEWNTATGQSLFQVGNDTASCTSDKTGRLRYNSGTDTWQYCDGSDWGPFEHAGASAGTPCSDDDAAECVLSATRSASDPDLVAGNIASGVTILGVTGTYLGPGSVAFSPFTDLDNLAPGTTYSSNIVQIIATDGSATSIAGSGSPQYRICAEAACATVLTDWTSAAATIDNRNYLQLRATASTTIDEIRTITASIASDDLTWSLRTTELNCTETGSQTYNYTGNIQTLDVTTALRECLFTITVVGGGGNGNSGGDADDGSGGGTEFAYTPSDTGTFHILVGQAGIAGGSAKAYGGGGGGDQYAGGGGASAIRFAGTSGSIVLAVAGGGGAGQDGGGSGRGLNIAGTSLGPATGGSGGTGGSTGGGDAGNSGAQADGAFSDSVGGDGYADFLIGGGAGSFRSAGGGGYGGGGAGVPYNLLGAGGGGYLNTGVVELAPTEISPNNRRANGYVTVEWGP